MNNLIIKVPFLYMCGMFLATFLSYLLPIIVIKRRKSHKSHTPLVDSHKIVETFKLISICNCLSAGIFLGICFLNLIPYVEQEFIKILNLFGVKTEFPVGLFVVILGVLLILTLETVIRHLLAKKRSPVLQLDDEESNKNCEKQEKQELIEVINDEKETEGFITDEKVSDLRQSDNHSHNLDILELNSVNSYLTFWLLIFAKSVHSIFEGLALGLQTDLKNSLHLFIGIVLHECLVSLALGLNSQQIDCQMKTNIKFATVLSSTLPIGIGLGVVLAYTPGLLGRSISGVFQGLAAGTFIHVTFHELIPSEFMSSETKLKTSQKLFKIFLLFIGFSIMALITALTQELE